MGSTSAPQHAEAPQHELPSPVLTRRAASPYFSFTTSLMSCVLTTWLPHLPSLSYHVSDRYITEASCTGWRSRSLIRRKSHFLKAQHRLFSSSCAGFILPPELPGWAFCTSSCWSAQSSSL